MNAVEYCLLHGLKLAGPEHPALLCAQESLSYGALAARVSQFAAGLREAGVRPNDRVGMLMLDTPDLIALHLGAVAAGAIAVAMSSRASAAELAQILAIVRPAAVVVDAEFASVTAGAVAASLPNTRLIWPDRELHAWKAIPATPLAPVRRQLGDPAFWVMTSGTTGGPKAVEHPPQQCGNLRAILRAGAQLYPHGPPVRHFTLPLRLRDRQHVRRASDWRKQHLA